LAKNFTDRAWLLALQNTTLLLILLTHLAWNFISRSLPPLWSTWSFVSVNNLKARWTPWPSVQISDK